MSKLPKSATSLAALALGLVLVSTTASAGLPDEFHPTEFAESKYAVLVDTAADRQQVRPGEEFLLTVRFVPYEEGDVHFHIYGSEPSTDGSYIPTSMLLDPNDNVTFQEPEFPRGMEMAGQSWLSGQTVVLIWGRVLDNTVAGEYTFTGRTMFAACTEDFCLQPSLVDLEWTLEVVSESYQEPIPITPREELTASAEIDMERYTLPDLELGGGIGGLLGEDGGEDSDDGAGTASGTTRGFDPDRVNVNAGTDWPLWKILLFALLGGLILNVMPCVLPVVSIKVIDMVKHVEKEPRHVINHGFIFAAGIIATFLAGAVVIAIIQAAGNQLGWGAQFQSPGFLLVMAAIIFVFGLSLADVFKIEAPQTVKAGGSELAEQEGYGGSFFKGVLATVLGTPCVGPFLGPALVVAFTLTWLHTLLIFAFVGIGMALPYLIMLPFITRMGRRERGKFSRMMQENKGWMDNFKNFMSFLMFATVIYLLYILQGVMGGEAVIWALVFLLFLGFASWLFARVAGSRFGMAAGIVAAILIALLGSWFAVPRVYAATSSPGASSALNPAAHEGWEGFDLKKLQEYTARGRTVLVDFTADWCPNCKTNEAVALNIDSTMALKEELDIVFMVADWTKKDDTIGKVLRALGFASVPLTAVFPGGDPNNPILLDGVFTAPRIQDAMREAASR